MRPYRLRKCIIGAGALLAGASLLAAPSLADDSAPRARPSRAPVQRAAPSPAARSSAPSWRAAPRAVPSAAPRFGQPGGFGARPTGPTSRPSASPTDAPRFGGRADSSPSPFAARGREAVPFRRGSPDAPFTPRGDGASRPVPRADSPSPFTSAPGWRGDRSPRPSSNDAPTRGGDSRGPDTRGGDAPRRMPTPRGETPATPGRFGSDRPNRNTGGGAPVTWRPPSRTPDSPGRGQPPTRTSPHPTFRPTGPNERPDNPNERSAPSWRIDPGRFTYINPRPNARPPRVDAHRWSGTSGLGWGGRDFHRVSVGYVDPWVVYQAPIFSSVRFYYPFYYVGPFQAGFYYSPFWVYGSLFPTYIYPERVIVVERRTYIRDAVHDDSFYDPYSAQTTTLRDTMEDIRLAWLDGDGGLLLRHINDAFPVRVLQKGDYKYSLAPDDYRDITKDALNRVETISFDWTNVDRQKDDVVALEARHTFRDEDDDKHTIRLTYTVEKARGSWWITQTDVAPW